MAQPVMQPVIGVATSVAAFIGRARRGPVEEPLRIASFADFEREFGGLWRESRMSYAVQQYFQNGGGEALIVRVHKGARAARLTRPEGFGLVAANEGRWGEALRLRIDHETRAPLPGEGPESLFSIFVKDTATGAREHFAEVSTEPGHRRFVGKVLEEESKLVRIAPPGTVPTIRPSADGTPSAGADPLDDPSSSTAFDPDGDDGVDIGDEQVATGAGLEAARRGLWALEKADSYGLLCIPPYADPIDVGRATWDAAIRYSKRRRAMVLVDPPSAWSGPADVIAPSGLETLGTRDANAALFFPRLRAPDPLDGGAPGSFAPCGAVAGVIARTDTERGVWKAPAGKAAGILGVSGLTVNLNDSDTARLNSLGVNCLRHFPAHGPVVWGARTLAGAASEWKYLPVRRLALFIEESVARGTKWVVFEPNAAPLWAQIRLSVGAFMHDLFLEGALSGSLPREAYFVKCDAETTTENEVALGVVNFLIGFAPLKPAEFVILEIQQRAGQIAGEGERPSEGSPQDQ